MSSENSVEAKKEFHNDSTSRWIFWGALLGIMIIGILFRFPLLSSVPNGFFCDEASVGYDAYSIMQTGSDRHGDFLPLFAKSFGVHTTAIYSYAAIPFIAIFGLNELGTRFPAALFGTLTIFVLYFFVRELFDKKVALVSAGLLAISPWHVQMSRMSWPTIFMPFFICLGLLFFIQAVKGKTKRIYLSALFFSLSIWTYQSARVFVPLFVFGVFIIYFKDVWRMRRHSFFASLLFLSVFVFFARIWISPEGMARANQVMEFSPIKVIGNYFSYFDPQYLFIKGDGNLRHSILYTGGLHLFEFITVVVGFFGILILFKRKESKLLLLWLFLYPIPAALTQQTHALRSFIGVPILAILSAHGFVVLASLFKTRKGKQVFSIGAAFIMIFSAGLFAKRYFKDYPQYSMGYWEYGMRDIVQYAEKESFENIVISSSYGGAMYTFVLFYAKISPSQFQGDPDLDPWGRGAVGKYHILSIPEQLKVRGRTLLIAKDEDMRKMVGTQFDWRLLHKIRDPNGGEIAGFFEVKNKDIRRGH